MSHQTPSQPKLTHLLAQFLNKQAQAHVDGFAAFDPTAEVTAYEAGPVQPIDAKVAWEEAVAVLSHFRPGLDAKKLPVPPHWAALVGSHEPVIALPFCVGNFPQLVRNFHMIVHRADLKKAQADVARPSAVPALLEWTAQVAAKKQFPQLLLAAGSLRLSKNFAEAEALVRTFDSGGVPAEWQAAWDNEKAALAWQRGQFELAASQWKALEPSVPVLFNRGMAELFLGSGVSARGPLTQAVAKLPDSSAWHHLGRLYLTLSASR